MKNVNFVRCNFFAQQATCSWLYYAELCQKSVNRLIHATGISAKDFCKIYRQTSNIGLTLVGNEMVDHSEVVGASPVGATPTASSFST